MLAMPALAHAAIWTSGGPEGLAGAVPVADPGDADHLFLVGDSSLYVTHDRGASWSVRTLPRDENGLALAQLHAYTGPPSVVVATGGEGEISRSTDDGRTWLPVGCCAVAIDPVDPDRVLGSGPVGFARSVDGGATWQPATPPAVSPNASLDYAFAGAGGVIWATSFTGIVLRSTDFAASWHAVTGVPNGTLLPVAGDAARLWSGTWRTLDGGISWQQVGPPAELALQQPFCARIATVAGAPQVPWLAGCLGLYRSTDGGDTWVPLRGQARGGALAVLAGGGAAVTTDDVGPWLVEPGREPVYRAHGLPRITPTQANFVADPIDPARAYLGRFSTADGGRTWHPDRRDRFGVARVGRRLVLAETDSTESTALDGSDRRQLEPGSTQLIADPSGHRAWLVIGAHLAVTTDGIRLDRLAARGIDANRDQIRLGVTGGRGGTVVLQVIRGLDLLVFVSRDGGRSFHARNGRFPLAVDAVDGRLMLAADDRGLVRRSTDAGRHYRTVLRVGEPAQVAVDPSRRGRWFAVGARGLFGTTNAGRTWHRLTRPPGGLVIDLSTSPGRLWAATQSLVSWRSMDGPR